MKLTIKYYAGFRNIKGSLLSKESWDSVRLNGESYLSFPTNKDDWLERSAEPELVQRAKDMVNICRELHLTRIFSVGVGCGYLECNIKLLAPRIHLTCTEYAPRTVEKLGEYFPECDSIEVFDMLGEWKATEGTLYLLHRVDTEFTDLQWKSIFRNTSNSRVEYILFVPSHFLTLGMALRRKLGYMRMLLRLKKPVIAGYSRTRGSFDGLWVSHYKLVKEVPIGNLIGFLLAQFSRDVHSLES
jgi:hypothetical protein